MSSAQKFEDLKNAAEGGYPRAQRELGALYYHGNSASGSATPTATTVAGPEAVDDSTAINVDHTLAVKWFRRAADQGDEVAQFNMGACYFNGHGVRQDLNESIRWYRMAAENGHYLSQRALYEIYRKGAGAGKLSDFNEAEEWYRAMNRYWVGSVSIEKVMKDGTTELKEHDLIMIGTTLVISRQGNRGKVTCLIELRGIGHKFLGVRVFPGKGMVEIALEHHIVSHRRWRKNASVIRLRSSVKRAGRISDGFEKFIAQMHRCAPFPPNISPDLVGTIINDVCTFFSDSRMDLFADTGRVMTTRVETSEDATTEEKKRDEDGENRDPLLFKADMGLSILEVLQGAAENIPIPILAQGLSGALRLACVVKERMVMMDEATKFKMPKLIESITDLEEEIRALAQSEGDWFTKHAFQAQKCYERAHGILIRTHVFTTLLDTVKSDCWVLRKAEDYLLALDALAENVQDASSFLESQKSSAQGEMAAKLLSKLTDVSAILTHLDAKINLVPSSSQERVEREIDHMKAGIRARLSSTSVDSEDLEEFAKLVTKQVGTLLTAHFDQSKVQNDESLTLIHQYWSDTQSVLIDTLCAVEDIRQRQIQDSKKLDTIHTTIETLQVQVQQMHEEQKQDREARLPLTLKQRIAKLKEVREKVKLESFYVEILCGKSRDDVSEGELPVKNAVDKIFEEQKSKDKTCSVLLLGPSGAGKSVAMKQIERMYWEKLKLDELGGKEKQFIPFFLELKNVALPQYAGKSLHEVALLELGGHLTMDDIEQLESLSLRPIWIFDAYDEMGSIQSLANALFVSGLSIVSCRQQFIDGILAGEMQMYLFPRDDYENYFDSEVRYLRPFNSAQIRTFIEKMLEADPKLAKHGSADVFDRGVHSHPSLAELASHPYMLKLIVGQLPRLADKYPSIKSAMQGEESFRSHEPGRSSFRAHSFRERVKVTEILNNFVTSYFERSQRKLIQQPDWPARFELQFTQRCRTFCQDLALAMFSQKEKTYVASVHDERFAKMFAFDPTTPEGLKHSFVLQSVPLESVDNIHWAFHHKALWEYFYACCNVAGSTQTGDGEEVPEPMPDVKDGNHPSGGSSSTAVTASKDEPKQPLYVSLIRTLGLDVFTQDRDLLHKHAELLAESPDTRNAYIMLVLASRKKLADEEEDRKLCIAASNAISVLNYGGLAEMFPFTFAQVRDWSGIRISHANLNHAKIVHCNLDGADLSHCTLVQAALTGSTFRKANLTGVHTRENVVFRGHSARVNQVCFSPDGMTLASCSNDSTVKLWDLKTMTERAELRAHTDNVCAISFNTSGFLLASASEDMSIRVWNVASEKCHAWFTAKTAFKALAFSPKDPSLLVSIRESDRGIQLWDVSEKEPKAHIPTNRDRMNTIVFSPDGKLLASTGPDRVLQFIRLASLQVEASFPTDPDNCQTLAFSPDGRLIAAGAWSGNIRFWDIAFNSEGNVEAHKRGSLKGHERLVNSICFSRDGSTLASGSEDSTIRLWSVSSRTCIMTLRGHSSGVTSVCFSPNGLMLASGAKDETIRLWNLAQHDCSATLIGHRERIVDLCFSPDGSMLAVCEDCQDPGLIHIVDCTSFHHKSKIETMGRPMEIAFSLDSMHLACLDARKTLCIYDVATGRCLVTVENDYFFRSVRFTPDGTRLVVGCDDSTIHVRDAETGELIDELMGHREAIRCISVNRSGRRMLLASASNDFTLRVWDLDDPSRTPLCEFEVGTDSEEEVYVEALCLSPDGSLLAANGEDAALSLYDVVKKKKIHDLKGHEVKSSGVKVACFDPQGKLLYSGGGDGTVRVWDVATLTCLAVLKGHTRDVNKIALHPNGRLLAVASGDYVYFWDLTSDESPASLGALSETEHEAKASPSSPSSRLSPKLHYVLGTKTSLSLQEVDFTDATMDIGLKRLIEARPN